MEIKKGNIVKRIYRKEDIEKINNKINLFGVNKKWSTELFLNVRFFSTFALFFIIFLFFDYGFIYAPVLSVAYYYLIIYFMIDLPLKERGKKLEHEAFYYFEVLTLTLESGRNLETAIDIACTYIDSEIANEFKETLQQIKFGKSLAEALNDMRYRIPSETVNNIILNITQSNIFGSSILETMYNQLDFLRDKQILDIKAEIAKIPTKISVFSVLFFVPLMMTLILAPIIIDFIINS
ncbi:MAG: type II secretion system F family protein [Bacilli bacterium]|jgi:tight adherence protein C|nr:type II secretion system F family protein [Bacilli bacterium]